MTPERRSELHETTIRMEKDLAGRLSVISQVLGESMNQLMIQGIRESVALYEGDPEYQEKRRAWIKNLASVGS